MEKSVWCRKKLAPFSLNLEELQALCSELTQEFDGSIDVSIWIEVRLPGGVSLKFDSVEEMMGYPSLPDVICKYKITMISGKQYLVIEFRSLDSFFKPVVSTSSEKEGWCVGVIGVAVSALRKHRVWYHWIPRFGFWFFVQIFLILLWFAPGIRDWVDSRFIWIGATIYLFAVIMGIAIDNILPASVIRVKEKESFMRLHYRELSLLILFIGAVVAVISLFKP